MTGGQGRRSTLSLWKAVSSIREGGFEEYAQDALDSLPSDLRAQMSNVEIVVEDEPPPGQRLLGLYQGVLLTRRGSHYRAVLATLKRTPWSPAELPQVRVAST